MGREHRPPVPLVHAEHLAEQRHRRVDQVVAEQHGERFAADVRFGDRDRMPEPPRLVLPHRVDLGELGELPDLLQLVELVAALEHRFELGRAVEVVLDRGLASSRDDQDVGETGTHGFLDHELDRRRVDQGQHLLGHGLGGRQEPRAQPCGRDDRLPHLHGRLLVREPKCTREATPGASPPFRVVRSARRFPDRSRTKRQVASASPVHSARMPTYEYVCRSCGHLFEIVQSMRDEPLTECPECGESCGRCSASGDLVQGIGLLRHRPREEEDRAVDG